MSFRECKHDIKSPKEMINPILKDNVQGQKHPGSCAFAEPELFNYRKPERVVRKNGHKNPNHSHNYHNEYDDEIELYQRNSKRSKYFQS